MQGTDQKRLLIKYLRDPMVLKGVERNLQVQEIVQNFPYDVVKETLNISLCRGSLVNNTEFSDNINDLEYRKYVFSVIDSAIDNGYLADRGFVTINIRYLKYYYQLSGLDAPTIVDEEYFKHLYHTVISHLESLTNTNNIKVYTIRGLRDIYNELDDLGLLDDELYKNFDDVKGKVIYDRLINQLNLKTFWSGPYTYRGLFRKIERLIRDIDTYLKLNGLLLDFYKDGSSSNYYKLRELYTRNRAGKSRHLLLFKGASGSTLAKFNRAYSKQLSYDEFLDNVECN